VIVTIAYATVEGQTRRIAEAVAATVRAAGHRPELIEAHPGERFWLDEADAAILCAPVHGGRYPPEFEALASDWAERLDRIPSAFVSVTLAILGDAAERKEAEGYAEAFEDHTGWRPRRVHHAAGALRYSAYDFLKRWIMRRVAHDKGIASDADQEFTDWPALEAFVRAFLAEAAPASA
jgi:menaquinone-dependent protoporphyrinogen oxidase